MSGPSAPSSKSAHAPSVWDRLSPFSSSRSRSKSSRALDEEEPLLSGPNDIEVLEVEGRQSRFTRTQLLLFLLFQVACFALGASLGKLLSSKDGNGKAKGPLVPPVWTLPPPTGDRRNPAYLIKAHSGAVASEDKTCSEMGVAIMRDHDGTAVDAAVTTTLCIGLLNGFASGIGGGGFMMVRVPTDDSGLGTKGGNMTAIDFRETSPKESSKEMYGIKGAGRNAAQVGGLAIGVPGELRGLEAAHKLYGKLPWKALVMPVADLAKGYQVSRELARRIRIFGYFMPEDQTWMDIYAPRGYLAVEGDYIKRINYGKTLERIADGGADAFYNGEIAEKMVKSIKKAGGVMTVKDLKHFEANVYPAIHHTYNGREIYTTAAPSSGGILLALLRLIEPFRISQTGGLDNPLNVHRFIESLKFAFAARSEVTDPAFVKDPERLDRFYQSGWADDVRAKITDNSTHKVDYYGMEFDHIEDHGTTHLSVVDQWGGVAAVTSTVNLIWGSHVMCPETGVIFNDEQDDFAVPGAPDAFGLPPSPWNYPAPGKKPMSSTSPTIILSPSGSLYATLGGSGGSRIFGSLAQVLLHLDAGLDISQAIEKPRYHSQVVPNVTTIEVGPEGAPERVLKGLRERGHVVGEFDINLGVSEIQGIVVQNGTIWASSDSRKNGISAGY
ncbi:putative gamma-glutamyltranspeptidase 1 precursor [Dioszegia hungarica]|uniref:Glutathione hydrolase n=1 Tax=Dioszegia hungarica TaxID=4972 RepID=A0AA38H7P3_9TREE|nr:putative gamma-glutamyltranspeptidase 1 precursor [Dioszegia hungarica]KAI9635467.1 putative gamma-glutamyltranspeptidase 1 precursor [Dioszegia hungarica]